jgi:hypothetical protein
MYVGGITGFYRHVEIYRTTNLILNFVLYYFMIQFRDGIPKIPVDEISDFLHLAIQNCGFFFDPRFSGTIGLDKLISLF